MSFDFYTKEYYDEIWYEYSDFHLSVVKPKPK